MKKNNYGRIVNITSIYVVKPEVELSGFNASKGALSTLTKTIAKEYVYNGQEKKKYYEMLVENSPIKRLVTTREIAKLVRYLLSDDASLINISNGVNIKKVDKFDK